MSIYLLIGVTVLLILVSAICSGLNVALMALDVADLKRRARLGNKDAKRALRIRKKTHLSLASILITNVAVISASSLVMSHFLNGVVAGVLSTLLIVVFGEILPQAFGVKYALKAISLFAPFLRLIVFIAYPIARPLEWLLDRMIGHDNERLHSRRELGLLIADHLGDASELDDDEVEIVRNALQLSERRVRDIMTPISDVYCLYVNDKIDARKIDELKAENWSRIPIFNKRKTDSGSYILLKELVDIDFDARAYNISELKQHEMPFVGSMTALDTMFRKFIAAKKHMMGVERNGKVVGVVTIEDLVESIIGHEIQDEGDAEKNTKKV